MSDSTLATPVWLTQAAALRYAQVAVTKLHKLVALGKVRTKADPGETVRYSAADLERWKAEQDNSAQPTAPESNPVD